MKRLLALMTVCMFLALTGCTTPEKQAEVTTYEYFDTITTVKVTGMENMELSRLIRETMEPLHAVFDIYAPHEGIAGAYALNASGGEWVYPEKELVEVLTLCREWNSLISPAADITMGALFEKWHEFRETGILPSDDILTEAAALGGWENLETDGNGLKFLQSGMRLDFGAVAKGYAAGKLAQAIEDAGYTDYIISAGGNVVCGKRDKPYRVGIQDPDSDGYSAVLNLEKMCAVTSGDYQRARDADGIKYHHIIDTDTLYPAQTGIRQVTVICADSAFADFMSTTLFLTPVDEGIALAEKTGIDAIWLLEDGSIAATPGAEKYIESK